ncbi:MAG: zinc-dependent alcohol dehydrogenase family protein [Chroococcus sp. CMT-3BRIN-NPC107]|jgi:NADPH2:quinone reductase|nr:zinc-dependent alcohol dehydrogenase family protein [Chroococcus sp. CMT-3BRIN-NPC107]
MKAILMTAAGKLEVLEVREIPEPQIEKPTEILVRLKAAGVNPIDTKLRNRGTFYPENQQAILGCDGAGIIEAVGTNVSKFKVGDEVYFCDGGLGGKRGNYAQMTVVDEKFAARKPSSISFVEAAAAPLVLITAWEALCDRASMQLNQKVLIHAGAGGVGHVAIQLAVLHQAKVCTTVGDNEKASFVRQLGAEQTILYKETDFVQAALDWTEGEGVNIGFDTVGKETFGLTFSATKIYGDVVTILEADPNTDWKTARSRNLRISYELILVPMLQGLVAAQQHQADILTQCADLIDSGKLKIHVNKVFPLSVAVAAHQLLEAGSITGKIVLQCD